MPDRAPLKAKTSLLAGVGKFDVDGRFPQIGCVGLLWWVDWFSCPDVSFFTFFLMFLSLGRVMTALIRVTRIG
jgi:hypothetical protein